VGGGPGSRTDGSRLNHVADGEPLDSLVLGSATGAVGAAHGLDVAAAVLVATAKESISLTFHIQTIFEVQSPLSQVPQRASVGRVEFACVVCAYIASVGVIAEIMSNGRLCREFVGGNDLTWMPAS
jgi:hypothetical protein